MFRFISIIYLILSGLNVTAQNELAGSHLKSAYLQLPSVFLMGEYERPYERMSAQYKNLLIQAYDLDLNKAYSAWTHVLEEMEIYAEKEQFNIKGLKLWMNVFFNKNGTIQHIAYYPKPNSRNMQTEHISNFLIGFCKNYQFAGGMPMACSHFGSASFPTFLSLN